MTDHDEHQLTGLKEAPLSPPATPEAPPPPVTEGVTGSAANGDGASTPGWRAEAGRKGAQRIHQLIERGKLYEQEHGLKRGRQRLRQLIEEGKLYEEEHGVAARRGRRRPARVSGEQLLLNLLQWLQRLSKPRYRKHVARLIQALESGAGD
jgi:hypothetical protein